VIHPSAGEVDFTYVSTAPGDDGMTGTLTLYIRSPTDHCPDLTSGHILKPTPFPGHIIPGRAFLLSNELGVRESGDEDIGSPNRDT
jgi:hypothetical protein